MSVQLITIFSAVGLTFFGIWMNWSMHRYRMSQEEAAKDERQSFERATIKTHRFKKISIGLTVAGLLLMVFGVLFLEP